MGPLMTFTSRKQTMKSSIFLKLAAVALLTVVTVTGCKKTPKNVTPLPGARTSVDANTIKPPLLTPDGDPTRPALNTLPPGGTGGTSATTIGSGVGRPPSSEPLFPPTATPAGPGGGNQSAPDMFDGMLTDRGAFAANTLHFDYDKAVVKASEVSKLQPVIAALKASPQNKLLIEGHCDERGTEEYNRSLGERRALAIRERLAKAGISPDRLRTVSFGEDKPAELGHTESAWAKNRRGELVLLKPHGL